MIDTHCHIHDPEFEFDQAKVLDNARNAGVNTLVCVGTSAEDSQNAVKFAQANQNVYASVAQHPHDAQHFKDAEKQILRSLADQKKVVAVGECGLDYYYSHSSKVDQESALHWHFQLAQEFKLPMLFHIRDAFEDFWPIFDQYPGVTGLVHCFTATKTELEQALERDLYVAFNGIMTFTKDERQLEALRAAPLEKIVLETDAPFLTPKPFRGKVNEPMYVAEVAKFISQFRNIPLDELVAKTDENAHNLLGI